MFMPVMFKALALGKCIRIQFVFHVSVSLLDVKEKVNLDNLGKNC